MEKLIHWGVIGPGNIAQRFGAALAASPNGVLRGVAGRNPERTRRFAATFDASCCYADAGELVRDPQIDAVYIALPHPFHFDVARMALEHGKAVLCEKPITLNRPQLEALIALAGQRQCFLMEAMWTRFLPVTRQVQHWIAAGEIGRLRMIYADFGFCAAYQPGHRLFAPELGGGALLDVGIYPLAYAQLFAGEPEQLASQVSLTPDGVDGDNAMLLRYPHDVLAMLSSSIMSSTGGAARLCGSEGSIEVPHFWGAERATLVRNNGANETFEAPHRVNGFEYEIEEVHRCLAAGVVESPGMPWRDSLALQQIMDRFRAD